MQVEIVNPQGIVSYRRPHGHPDVAEALRTRGYSVHCPKVGMPILEHLKCMDGVAYKVVVDPTGLTITTPDQFFGATP
jgi:hypothetical protein